MEKGEMSALRRSRIFIFVAVAVLFAVTIFSVTFCKWESPYKTATASGKVGSYYVSYAADATTDETVRQVSASTVATTVGDGAEYVYENYVCVNRTVGATDESTAAYINFYAEGSDLSATVLEFTVTRHAVDASGNPTEGNSTDVSVYNSPVDKTLGDISPVDGTDAYSGQACKIGGTYVMVYFGKNDKQYQALHITIKTDKAATFTLRAEASNKDKETVYVQGFGKPETFYLGWEYDEVSFFDPSAASEMTGTCSKTGENIDGATVDKTVTVSLNYGASVKAYRLSTGSAETGVERVPEEDDHRTRYFIPKNVKFDATKLKCEYGTGTLDQTNIFIEPLDNKLHQYKIRISGTVDGTVNKAYNLQLNGVTKKTYGLTSGTQDRFIDIMEISIVDQAPAGYVYVHFNTNGGNAIEDVTAKKGETYTPDDPTRSGYTFAGWYTDKALNTLYDDTVAVSAEMTLYAKWNVTVTFNSNGGSSVDEQTIAEGGKATKPTDPTKDNYNFGGWYSDSALTKAFDFDTAVTANTTLYAKWDAVSNIVTGSVDSSTCWLVGSGAFATKYGITDSTWSTGIKPTSTGSSPYRYENIYFEKNDEFKFRSGSTWYNTSTDSVTNVTVNNSNYHIGATGWYTLVYNTSTQKLSATFVTSLTSSSYFLVGSITGNDTVDWDNKGIAITKLSGTEYQYEKIYLTANDLIRFRSSSSRVNASIGNVVVNGSQVTASTYLTTETDPVWGGNNLRIKKTGYYSFYLQPSNNIVYVVYASSI
ncbi:MAG: InlB B-repeat-containing protein [Roseburia sp.]|nr:InlB B-repeat-containing protein [Roseburia sp.]